MIRHTAPRATAQTTRRTRPAALLCCALLGACAGVRPLPSEGFAVSSAPVRAQRAAFARGSSTLLAVVDGSLASVLEAPCLRPRWSRTFPLTGPERLTAEPSASGRLLIARSGRRLWVAGPSGPPLLDLAFDEGELARDLPGTQRTRVALSQDERWLAIAWQRTVQVWRLPSEGDAGLAQRIYLPLTGALAGYPRCAGGEDGLCGVLSVSLSRDGAWLLVLHRPAEEESAAALVHLGDPLGQVDVPIRPDAGPDVAFLGGSSDVLFERFGALRRFTPPRFDALLAMTAGASEQDAPGAPPASSCGPAAAALSRLFPTAVCAERAAVALRDLSTGKVLARAPLAGLGQETKAIAAAGESSAAVLVAATGEVLLLGAGESALRPALTVGPRLVLGKAESRKGQRTAAGVTHTKDPPAAPATLLPAAFSDDARALFWFTDPEHVAAARLW